MAFADKAIGLDDNTQILIYQQMRLMCQAHVYRAEAVAVGEQLFQILQQPRRAVSCRLCFPNRLVKNRSSRQQDQFAAVAGNGAVETVRPVQGRNLFVLPLKENKNLTPLNWPRFVNVLLQTADY